MKFALISFLLPSLALADVVGGIYRSAHGTVQLSPIGSKYRVHIETEHNQFSCEFDGVGEEVDEGALTFHKDDCTVEIDQDDSAGRMVSVKATGCEFYCGAGATLDIARARR